MAPTLEVEWLLAAGISIDMTRPKAIASAFHEFSSRGVAVCNTLAVSEFHEAFGEQHVEMLSWIHELPTFITLLGGHSRSKRSAPTSRQDHGAVERRPLPHSLPVPD